MSELDHDNRLESQNTGVEVGSNVSIARTARIYPSVRGTLVRIGDDCEIYDFVVIRCVGGSGDVVIGSRCHINPGCMLYSGNGIMIGDDTLIAAGTVIAPTNHAFGRRDIPIRQQGFMPSRGGVRIGRDVWIGSNCTLLDGTDIGEGSILAAGAVVNCKVPPFEIWGGVPAVKLRERPNLE